MTWRARALLVAGVVTAPGCGRTGGQADAAPSGSARPSSDAAALAAGSSSGFPTRAPLGEGCHADVDPRGTPAEVATRIAASCAPGSTALAAPVTEHLALGAARALRVRVEDPARCLRVIAVGEDGTGDVALEVAEADAGPRRADELPGRVAMVGARGPVCLRAAGELTVTARATGAGEVAVGVWQAP